MKPYYIILVSLRSPVVLPPSPNIDDGTMGRKRAAPGSSPKPAPVPDDLEHERVPETEPDEHSSERDQQQEQGLEGRIIVRNLPARIDEAALRAHFGSVGEVTDARLIVRGGAKGSSGKATRGGRRFGFVGFGDAASAEAAIARFDRTFLGSARLAVARALPRDSAALPRPWSRHSAGSSAHERSHPAAAAAKGGGVPVVIEVAGSGSKENRGGSKGAMEAGAEAAPETEAAKRKRLKVERQQREFLSVMNHKRAETEGGTAFWANDDAALQQQKQRSEAPKPRDEDGNDDDEDSSDGDDDDAEMDDDDDDGDAMEGRASESDDDDDDDDDDDGAPPQPRKAAGSAAALDGALDDMAYLRANMTANLSDDDESDLDDDGGGAKTKATAKATTGTRPRDDDDDDDDDDESMSSGDDGGLAVGASESESESESESDESDADDGGGGSGSDSDSGDDLDDLDGAKKAAKKAAEKAAAKEAKKAAKKAAKESKRPPKSDAAPARDDGGDDAKDDAQAAKDEIADAEDDDDETLEPGRLFVRNVPYSTDESELRAYFEPFGDLTEVHVPLQGQGAAGADDDGGGGAGRPRGFAFIQYVLGEEERDMT